MKFNVKRYFQVLGVSLSVIIVAAAVCLAAFDFYPKEQEQEIAAIDNTSTVAVQGGKINILLMGVDIDGLRTDAIMLACIDTDANEVKMLTVPRDTEMYIGNRYQKINAAHAYMGEDGKIGGPTATCEAVTRLTGIPINYYIDFSFDAVAHVINELGPIEFDIPDLYDDGVGMVYDDPVQSLHINLPPGHYGEGGDYPGLTGKQAVWLMRYRHGNYEPDIGMFKGYANGDSDRVEMQQKFIKAVVDQKVNSSLVLKIPAIFKDISSEIKTNLTVNDVIQYSKFITNFSSDSIKSYQLPGSYATDQNGDVWIPDLEAIKTLVEEEFGYDASNITTENPENMENAIELSIQPTESSRAAEDDSSANESSSERSSSSSRSSSSYTYTSGGERRYTEDYDDDSDEDYSDDDEDSYDYSDDDDDYDSYDGSDDDD